MEGVTVGLVAVLVPMTGVAVGLLIALRAALAEQTEKLDRLGERLAAIETKLAEDE